MIVPWLPPVPLSPFSFFNAVAISTRKIKSLTWQWLFDGKKQLNSLPSKNDEMLNKINTYFEWQWTIDVSAGKIDR